MSNRIILNPSLIKTYIEISTWFNRRFIEVKVNSRIAFDNEKIKSEMKNGGGARSSSERIIASLEEIATTTSEEEESKAAKKAKIDNKFKT